MPVETDLRREGETVVSIIFPEFLEGGIAAIFEVCIDNTKTIRSIYLLFSCGLRSILRIAKVAIIAVHTLMPLRKFARGNLYSMELRTIRDDLLINEMLR